MFTSQVPSLQALSIANLSSAALNDLNQLCMPELPTQKEQTNIRVLGTHNPIKIVTPEQLADEILERRDNETTIGYIHPAVGGFGIDSPRSRRFPKHFPEKRRCPIFNVRYTKVEFYDYYYYDHKIAQSKWEDAEERFCPEDTNYCYTKAQFYDYYKNKKEAELKWRWAQPLKNTDLNNSNSLDNYIYYGNNYANYNHYDDYDRISDID